MVFFSIFLVLILTLAKLFITTLISSVIVLFINFLSTINVKEFLGSIFKDDLILRTLDIKVKAYDTFSNDAFLYRNVSFLGQASDLSKVYSSFCLHKFHH